ncbi:hypothetical protein LCGC14_1355200 [marine sediment metagenome]|uniref:Ryanodine receptor Ryr domain-containing protein n=1 Tax=marine sediment metagenome TaxID=412755 RepID=A0A0F9KVW7_9ZZZZ|nr:hypothetical protein [Candidatus Aminicenantes bacterium]
MTINDIAKVCHDANKSFCEIIGDESQLPWIDAPQWQRSSSVDGVIFNLNNPGGPPSGSHERWLMVKAAEGWKHGKNKDPEAKTHPCILPFDKLPEEQQIKDHIFKAIVNGLAIFCTDERQPTPGLGEIAKKTEAEKGG